MTRYFLHLDGDIHYEDPDGAEHPGLYSAIQMAIQAARELIASAVLSGVPIDLRHKLILIDENGVQQAEVPFDEAITIVS